MIYPNDHRPAHVHVIGGGCEAVFALGCGGGRVRLRENYGFGSGQLRRIKPVLQEQQETLCEAWEKIHGME